MGLYRSVSQNPIVTVLLLLVFIEKGKFLMLHSIYIKFAILNVIIWSLKLNKNVTQSFLPRPWSNIEDSLLEVKLALI